jgi:hypothetical protein
MAGTHDGQQGAVDSMVAGAVHTTAATVRRALQILGNKPRIRLMSSVSPQACPTRWSSMLNAPSTPAGRRRPSRHSLWGSITGSGLDGLPGWDDR